MRPLLPTAELRGRAWYRRVWTAGGEVHGAHGKGLPFCGPDSPSANECVPRDFSPGSRADGSVRGATEMQAGLKTAKWKPTWLWREEKIQAATALLSW